MASITAAWRLVHIWWAVPALTLACSASDLAPATAAGSSPAGSSSAGSGPVESGSAGSSAGGELGTGGTPRAIGGSPANAAGAPPSSAGAAPTSGNGDCAQDGDGRTTLVFVNRCSAPVTFRGSDIQGGVLAPGATSCVDIGSDVEAISSKRFWGFRGADPGGEHHSLAEFTFNTDFNDFDWYNISYVDAFNLPLQIAPLVRPKCKVLTCAADFLAECPSVGRFEDSAGNLVSCVSPDRDNATSPVALYFESCDDAYAWSGDDQKGDDPSPMRACAGEDWRISFCPAAP